MARFNEMMQLDGLPGLSDKLEFDERHRAEELGSFGSYALARALVERERQLAEALRALKPART